MADSIHRKLIEYDGKILTARELREIFCFSPATALSDTYIRKFLTWQTPPKNDGKNGRRIDKFKVDIPPAFIETWINNIIDEEKNKNECTRIHG
jgi:hypothetical protein